MSDMTRLARIEFLVFAAVFVACAAFHSGGGWNQNARFAQVRSIVEEGRFAVDDFLVYLPEKDHQPGKDPASGTRLRLTRLSISSAVIAMPVAFASGKLTGMGQVLPLAWRNSERRLIPIRQDLCATGPAPRNRGDEYLVGLESVSASGDVAYANGHFYPNKPPGASLVAVPAYAAALSVERIMGWNPDDWWVFTVNGWIATIGSAGLASALGAVLLFRIARRFAITLRVALAVAFAYAFGTMALPYGTLLFDQNITAAALLGAFSCLLKAREEARGDGGVIAWAFLAGACAGGAAVCNYIAGAALILFTVYAGRRLLGAFVAGTLGPLGFLAFYQAVCFGSPLALATSFQNPLFSSASAGSGLSGLFGLPRLDVILMLLGSPFRGLFFLSPVLILAAWGLWKWWSAGTKREASLCFGLMALFFIVNASFAAWHGGYGVAPRYLGPAIPFLALGLVAAWPVHPRLCRLAALISVMIQGVLTVTDPLSPVGTGSVARDDRPDWLYCSLTDYNLPLLITGRAWPMLNSLSRNYLNREEAVLAADGAGAAAHRDEMNRLRGELHRAVERGDAYPFPLAAFTGPVSANPMGMCEGDFFQRFEPGSVPVRWNAWNVGEFVWPESVWSLLPIIGLTGLLAAAAGTCARQE